MLPVPVYRRFGAFIYDSLLHLALWLITAGAFNGLVLRGQALQPEHEWLLQVTLFPLLLLVSLTFSSYFWIRNQQTLGMQAWRLAMAKKDNHPIQLKDAAIRMAISFFSLGFGMIWSLFDRNNRSLEDIFSPLAMGFRPKEQ